MKSLEVFFFVPFLIYFLFHKQELQLVKLFTTIPSHENLLANWTPMVLLLDLIVFACLTLYLLLNNQKKKINGFAF